MGKQKSYLDIGFNRYLTGNEDLDERIKIDKVIQDQENQQLSQISNEIAHIWSEIYDTVNSKGITKDVKIKLIDDYFKGQLIEAINRKHAVGNIVDHREVGLAIAKISKLKDGLVNETEVKLEAGNVTDEPKKPLHPLELILSGNQLLIEGYIIDGSKKLTDYHTDGNGLLLVPIFKICMARPTTMMRLTKNGLIQCAQREGPEMQKKVSEVLDNPAKFSKYLSKILKGVLKQLFVTRTSGGLGIRFRRAVPEDEWQRLSDDTKKKIVKYLSEIPSF